ncbi:MAG: hypothetical protein M1834_001726 [Cirrosporium novae-zelandiae]|nr:MAG: hypothetical protein M1834_001726 [Cirrosporium novae-zelandiae]
MNSEQVIKIPRSNDPETFILLNIKSTKASSSEFLDLKLVGTEQEHPYVGRVRQRDLHKLRSPAYHGDDEELGNIIRLVFLRQKVGGISMGELKVTADIENERLSISVRKCFEGITVCLGFHDLGSRANRNPPKQRVAEIHLGQDDEEDIDLMAWCGLALDSRTTLESDILHLSTKVEQAQARATKLDQQLQGFITAKEEHENAMLAKFQELLNAKKLKIRDQQRLLTGARVDVSKASQLKASRGHETAHDPLPSRSSKRKARKEPSTPSTSDESDFETMDVDRRDDNNSSNNNRQAENVTEDDSDGPSTPDKSDLDTTEDEDEDEGLDRKAVFKFKNPDVKQKGKAISPTISREKKNQANTESIPPRRELPFARRRGGKQKTPEEETVEARAPEVNEGGASTTAESTEDEDDEL